MLQRLVGGLVVLVMTAVVVASATLPALAQGSLQVSLIEDPFVCNGGTRTLGTVSGLNAGEDVEFAAPQLDGVFSTREADEDGQVSMKWTCTESKRWDITVRGVDSGRTVAFSFNGVASSTNAQAPLGAAFDAKSAMTIEQMAIWKDFSPYNGVGIYLPVAEEFDNRDDKEQVNLTPAWMDAILADGWRVLPIYVGLQAPAACEIGRFLNMSADGATARAQGAASAADAVASMQGLGVGPGAPIYYDMEGYRPGCGRVVISFLEGWTEGVRAAGYLSGVYGSQNSVMTDLTAAARTGGFVLPDAIWVSSDTRVPGTLGLDAPPDDLWTNARIHQYHLHVTRTYGGVTREVDDNIINGPVATFAPPAVDTDGDGHAEPEPDNCDGIANPDQADLDGDGDGDVCDRDVDGDGIDDPSPDNCDRAPNPDQADLDGDGDGDACDPDIDGDLVANADDPDPRDPQVPAPPTPVPTEAPAEPTAEPTAVPEPTASEPEPEPTPSPAPAAPEPAAPEPTPEAEPEAESTPLPAEPPAQDVDAEPLPAIIELPTPTPLPTAAPQPTPTPLPTVDATSTDDPQADGEPSSGAPDGSGEQELAAVTITTERDSPFPWRGAAMVAAALAAVGFGTQAVRSFRNN